LLSSDKINRGDVRKSLNQLVEKGSMKEKDARSIMNSLKMEPDSYVATKTGTKFHRKDCITLKKISKQNQMTLKNKEEAKGKGFTKCSVCKP